MPECLEQVMLSQNNEIKIKLFVSPMFDSNCYVLYDTHQAIVVDPSVSLKEIKKEIDVPTVGVFLTHGHVDHIWEIESFIKENIKIYLHKHALEKLGNANKNYSNHFRKEINIHLKEEQVEIIHDKQNINIFQEPLVVIETPGHTNCSIMLLVSHYMLSGDTLFFDTIGRTDLFSGNSSTMIESIKKIKQITTNYQVYPGHGVSSTLDREKECNHYFTRSIHGKNR